MLKNTRPIIRLFGGRGLRWISVLGVLLLMVLMCGSQIPSVRGASTATSSTTTSSASSIPPDVRGEITIDAQQFESSVPAYAVLGTNYTLKVVIQSSVDIVVPVIVKVSTPVQAIFVHPQAIHLQIQPESSMIANFTILPFGAPRTGPYNVTALLYVFFPLSMSSPELVDQTTVIVSSIGPNPFPYLTVAIVSAAVVTLVLVAVFYPGIFRRRSATTQNVPQDGLTVRLHLQSALCFEDGRGGIDR